MEEELGLWLEKAKESLDDAIHCLSGHRYSLTAFSCQQALEKFLKAAIIKLKRERPRKIHDLLPLLRDSGLKMPKKFVTEMAQISKFYFLVRYPDLNKKFFATPEVAKKTMERTKKIYSWIEKKLNKP